MTLEREVAIDKLAARLRNERWGSTDDDAYMSGWERGARAGLAHMWPLLEALHGALEVLDADAERLGLDPRDHHQTIRAAIKQATS